MEEGLGLALMGSVLFFLLWINAQRRENLKECEHCGSRIPKQATVCPRCTSALAD